MGAQENQHIQNTTFLSDTYAGKAHDQSLADRAGSILPHESGLEQERGCQGVTREGMTLVQPQKKPRGGELTPPAQATNRALSSISIRIDHAIGGVKRYRMVNDTIRLLKDGIRDIMMETCGGRHHVRRQYRPWHDADS